MNTWLNYHHLFYFWTIAREGSISKASKTIRLAQPTLSAQISTFENNLGKQLFLRQGRGLVLTEFGTSIKHYADKIFELGRDLQQYAAGQIGTNNIKIRIGISDAVPKMLSIKVLEPLISGKDIKPHIQVRENTSIELLKSLSTHELDVVISDHRLPPNIAIKVHHHTMIESTTSFLASRSFKFKTRKRFPEVISGLPFIFPSQSSELHSKLSSYFSDHNVSPQIIAEVDDAALLKLLAQKGFGIIAVPDIIVSDVCRQYDLQVIGKSKTIINSYYAITAERMIRNPAVDKILASFKPRSKFRSKS